MLTGLLQRVFTVYNQTLHTRQTENVCDNFSNLVKSELKFTNLRVTMPDGTVIHHQASNETYIEVLSANNYG